MLIVGCLCITEGMEVGRPKHAEPCLQVMCMFTELNVFFMEVLTKTHAYYNEPPDDHMTST